MWKAPFTARNRASGPSSLTTLDDGAAKGYTRIPPVERAVAMQLCPNSTWRGEPSLPSRACKHSSDLTGRAYQACGEAASALHAMALLQVHQAKALRDLHEGGHDPQPADSSTQFEMGTQASPAPPVRPVWGQGFTALTSLYPRKKKKVVGYDRSWICEFWIGAFTSYRSRCSRRNAFSSASVPGIGLQRSTWRTRTFMSRFFLDTGRFCALRSRVEHISTRSYPSGWPCLPASSRKSWREPLFPWENRASASSTISTTGSFSLSLGNSYANTGIWCSVTSASWAFRSTGKRANSPQCRGSLFSVWSWIRSNSQHASQRNVLSRCWTAWIHSGAGQRSHWNFFRGIGGVSHFCLGGHLPVDHELWCVLFYTPYIPYFLHSQLFIAYIWRALFQNAINPF